MRTKHLTENTPVTSLDSRRWNKKKKILNKSFLKTQNVHIIYVQVNKMSSKDAAKSYLFFHASKPNDFIFLISTDANQNRFHAKKIRNTHTYVIINTFSLHAHASFIWRRWKIDWILWSLFYHVVNLRNRPSTYFQKVNTIIFL